MVYVKKRTKVWNDEYSLKQVIGFSIFYLYKIALFWFDSTRLDSIHSYIAACEEVDAA